jgi:hypothetical protein
MITIRYANLPEGSHAQAVLRGRRTVIYLRPGLTPEQRRHSLRRARQAARMGHGPELTATGVALAVAHDSVRVTLRTLAAAVRGHPVGSLVLAAGVTGAVLCYALLVTVSIKFMAPQQHYGFQPLPGARAVEPGALGGNRGGGGVPGRLVGPPPGGTAPGGGRTPRVSGQIPSPRASRGGPGPTPPASPGPSPSPSLTSPPAPLPSATPSPSRSPRPSASASPAPSPSPSGLCVLGICL